MTDRGGAKWLDATEQRAWRAWVDSSRRVVSRIERQLRDDHGITIDDYEVLVRLSEADGHRIRMTDLGARVANSPSRISQRVDRLVARGWIARERSREDGRVAYALLTREGFDFLASIAPDHVREVRTWFVDRLTRAQIKALADVLPALLEDDQAL